MAAVVALLALALRKRRRAAKGVAFSAVLFALVGCPGVEPVPDAGPETTGASGDPIYYFHNDRQGTPVRLTNEAGATVWRAEYRPFGDVERLETDVDGDGVHVDQPLRFAGQYDDALSSVLLAQGPYYNWNRSYEPATGRFFSPEPLIQESLWVKQEARSGFATPTYGYGRNSPLRYTDPDGRTAVEVAGGALTGAILTAACIASPVCRCQVGKLMDEAACTVASKCSSNFEIAGCFARAEINYRICINGWREPRQPLW